MLLVASANDVGYILDTTLEMLKPDDTVLALGDGGAVRAGAIRAWARGASIRRCRCRRFEVLHQLREGYAASREVLPGVRRGSAIAAYH